MSDLFSFNYQPAQSHSKTSLNGLIKADESGVRQTQVAKILNYLNNCGVDGGSIREISNHFKIGMNIASARIRDIERSGRIIKTALTRKAQGSEVEGEIYIIKDRHLPYHGLGEIKKGPTKHDFERMKAILEEYGSGLSDNGFKAREFLQVIDPAEGK